MTNNMVKYGAFIAAILLLGACGGAETDTAEASSESELRNFTGTWTVASTGPSFLNDASTASQGVPEGSVCLFPCPEANGGVWPPPGKVVNAAYVEPEPVQTTVEPAAQAAIPQGAPRPGPERPKYKQEYLAMVADLDARQVDEDPLLTCTNPGVPRIGAPDKIVQNDEEFIFMYDDLSGQIFRIIPLNAEHRDVPLHEMGDSIGYWEGNTLVVETINFTGDTTWLTDDGSFHTGDLKVVEKLHREGDSLIWQATAYDPAVLAEPWAMSPRTLVAMEDEILYSPKCSERSLELMVDRTVNHDNAR